MSTVKLKYDNNFDKYIQSTFDKNNILVYSVIFRDKNILCYKYIDYSTYAVL